MGVVKHLNSLVVKSSVEIRRRVTSVLIILDLLYKMLSQKSTIVGELDNPLYKTLQKSEIQIVGELDNLFSMLVLKPATYDSDLKVVMNFIPESYQKHVARILAHFVNKGLSSNRLKRTSWVYVLPLMHALDDVLNSSSSAGDIRWDSRIVEICKIGKAPLLK
jgi:hypothetical protein